MEPNHPHLFEPLTVKSVTLRNRVSVSPMCRLNAGNRGRNTCRARPAVGVEWVCDTGSRVCLCGHRP
ncbi:MAG: hypothetical protein KGJ60_07325 [Verrucomicrobiota bacterium]|nr:hypothetical protein [Verrucomicrobiota bacterium]